MKKIEIIKDIVIFGAGGLGKEVLELIHQINKNDYRWNVAGFFDDTLTPGTVVNGIVVLGNLKSLQLSEFKNVAVAIGNPEARANLIDILSAEKTLPVLIHPSATVSEKNVFVEYGTIIAACVFLSVNVKIGSGVLLNVGCSIGHDVEIGDFCTINPGVRVSGSVKVGDFVFVGVGAILNNNISIANYAKIGAGAVVIKSIEKKSTVFGNPARIILE
jgi:sugar O-acyltransferase (sialic acid O-acetyltransferase NeuD family)